MTGSTQLLTAYRTGLEVPIKTTKEQITYWATPNLREFSPSRFPVWISVEEKDCYYGFPVYGEVSDARLL